jgi:ABC-type glycerol-3-phosphate transport system substrate-binding protein
MGLSSRLSRRGFVASAATAASAVLLAACGSPPPPTKPAVEPPKPVEAPKPAAAGAEPTKPAGAAAPAPGGAPTPLPTPTLPPAFTPVAQASGTTKLLMRVHWSGNFFNEFQKIINDYNSTQGTKDKIYIALERFVAGQAGPIGTFIADFQAGTQEDIYHLNDAYLADLASRNFFTPPPQEIQNYIKDNFLPSAVATGTWEGKIMGHPTENQPHMMFVNKKMFEAAKLDATKDTPKKWDDIRKVSKALVVKDASGVKTQAGWIAKMNAGEAAMVPRVLSQFLNGAPLVKQDGGGVPKFDVTSDGARAYTELLAGMAADESTSAGMGEVTPVWGQRRGAMITHDAYSVFFTVVSTGQPGLLEEQYTQALYSADGTKTGNISRNYHFENSSKSKNKDLAWTFLTWMNHGPEFRMQNFQTNTFGFVPSVKNFPLPKFFPDQMKEAFNSSLKEPMQTGMPVIRGLAEVYNIMRDHHDALMNKKETAAEFTKNMDEELKKVMESAYSKT